MPELRDLDPAAVARLVVAVGAYRATHGAGPTCRQAQDAAGWTWHRMRTLVCAGLVTVTGSSRQLDVTPAGRRWALAVLSPARAARRKGLV